MNEILLYFATMIGIYGIAAVGLNFQYGIAGLLNFGVIGFFGIAAYTSSLLALGGVPPVLAMLAGAVASMAASALVALPTQRLNVHYWAITTIALSEVLRVIFLNEDWLTRGSFGLVAIPRPFADLVSAANYPALFAGFVWLFALVSVALATVLTRSPFGLALRAVREDDDLPLSLGKPIFGMRVQAMAIGGLLIGLAGALYAHFVTYISPMDFTPTVTFTIWAMVIIGGRGNLSGSLVGAVIVVLFMNSTRFAKDWLPLDAQLIASLRIMAIGALIMWVIVFRPDGLLPERKRIYPNG